MGNTWATETCTSCVIIMFDHLEQYCMIQYLHVYCTIHTGGDCWRLHDNHRNTKEAVEPTQVCDRREMTAVLLVACHWVELHENTQLTFVRENLLLIYYNASCLFDCGPTCFFPWQRPSQSRVSQQKAAPSSVDALISPCVGYWWCHIRSHTQYIHPGGKWALVHL